MRVLLSLGSNIGDRCLHLESAVDALRGLDGVRVVSVSSWYETEPWGVPGQFAFLNGAVEIETDLAPLELLNAAQAIERRLGRLAGVRWGPRVIDVDLILWGAQALVTPKLTLPHKEFRNRAFVLVPLAEIAGDAIDPITGLRIAELLDRPEVSGRVEQYED